MPLPRMSDYDKKRNIETIRKVATPQGGVIPEIDRNVTTVGTGQITATSVPQQLSYVSRDKMAVKLTNLSAVDVYWGSTNGLIPGDLGNGDLLPGGRGNWVNIPSPSVIWVATVAGTTARISWAEAYDD